MVQPGRKYSVGSGYRYGFNGKENDKDISKGGQDYGMRVYDVRISKFLSIDPLSLRYPFYTPYSFAGNKPIVCLDLDGAEEFEYYIKLDEQGRTFLRLDNIKRQKEHSTLWGAITWTTPIPERYNVWYNGKNYLIGFKASEGGAGNEYKVKFFGQLIGRKDFDARIIPFLFYNEDESSKKYLNGTLNNLVDAMVNYVALGVSTGLVLKVNEDPRFLGANGPSIKSKTVWQKKESIARIDVENPSPGQRAGSLHYQDENNVKYQYNVNDKKFYGESKTDAGVFNVEAPRAVQDLLKEKNFQQGIDKGLKYLGEEAIYTPPPSTPPTTGTTPPPKQ